MTVKKIVLLLIFLSLLSSCCTTQYVYLEPEPKVYPAIPVIDGLVDNPVTKDDYRINTVVLSFYILELKSYIEMMQKIGGDEKSSPPDNI